MAKAELTTVENFKIVTGMEAMDEELRAELEDEMDDLDDDGGIDAKHIKIPSGGGKAFEVETDDPDDPEVMKEVTGVIIFTHRMNAYWAQKFGEAGEDGNINKSPDCSSMDGKQGMSRETGEIRTCDTCPYNQFGSDGKGNGDMHAALDYAQKVKHEQKNFLNEQALKHIIEEGEQTS